MAALPVKKTIKLRIKVPANVTIVVEQVPVAKDVTFGNVQGSPGANIAPTVMDMDLTSQKTSEWLGKKKIVSSDCANCCCVRG